VQPTAPTSVHGAPPGAGAGPVVDRGRSGIITPEAVLLQFETAGIATRAVARALDAFVAAFIGIFLIAVLSPFVRSFEDVAVLQVILVFVVVFAYPALFEWLRDGRTVGKSALGLRVVTEEGAPIRFRHAAIRSALQVVDIALLPVGGIAILSSLAGRSDQRLGDRLAGTIVLRVGQPGALTRAVAFPPLPGLETYVANLDVSGVTAEQYEVLRSFLTRVGDLSPASRVELAAVLARPLQQVLHHTPPPQLHPEHFLASVAAAYQRLHGGPSVSASFLGWQRPAFPTQAPQPPAAPAPAPGPRRYP
jgi:uncharacterized RDD family membrane protein YckC